MPAYAWLLTNKLDTGSTPSKIRVFQMLNTPYPKGYDKEANADLREQSLAIAKTLQESGVKDKELDKREIIAIIAYLQRLGTDIKTK